MAEPVLETIDSALSALSHASESIPSRVLRDSEAMVCHSGTVRAKQRASPYPTERTTAMLVETVNARMAENIEAQLEKLIDLRDTKLETLRTELTSIIRCPICLDSMSRPHFLHACQHAFCGTCISRFPSSTQTCPFCRAELAHSARTLSVARSQATEDALRTLTAVLSQSQGEEPQPSTS